MQACTAHLYPRGYAGLRARRVPSSASQAINMHAAYCNRDCCCSGYYTGPENSDPTAQAEALIAKTTNKVGEESMDGKA